MIGKHHIAHSYHYIARTPCMQILLLVYLCMPVFGVCEFMNSSTCFCPIVVYTRSMTNENNIVSATLKEEHTTGLYVKTASAVQGLELTKFRI